MNTTTKTATRVDKLWWQLPAATACWLLLLVSPPVTAATLQTVECPSTLRTFTAVTEMVFEGRTDFLSIPEGNTFTREFVGVYNGLTESSCDRYFRRIGTVKLVNMTNTAGDFMDLKMRQEQAEAFRLQQEQQQLLNDIDSSNITDTTSNNTGRRRLQDINGTDVDVPRINMIYEVQGTCRDCPLTRVGSFDLYDETFRRQLERTSGSSGGRRLRIRTRVVSVVERDLQDNSTDDCQCVEGALPVKAQAPGVQECVDQMNDIFDTARQDTATSDLPLYQDIALTQLVQLDDLEELEIENGDVYDEEQARAPTQKPQHPAMEYNIWTR